MTLNKKVLVTGCAGFIGYHLALKLLKNNYKVVGIDNINNYYSKKLKQDRINDLKKFTKLNKKNFTFYKFDLSNQTKLEKVYKNINLNKLFILLHKQA